MEVRFYNWIIFFLIIAFAPNSFSQSAGAIPNDVAPKDIHVIIDRFQKSGWSLRVGDRRINGSDFVVSNWANTHNHIVVLGGILGVLTDGSASEKILKSEVEKILKNDFNLQLFLKRKIENDEDFNNLVGGIGTTTVKRKYSLVLQPYSLIYANGDGILFNPQILAKLFDENNKPIWSSVYGEMSDRKKWAGEGNSWDLASVDAMLNEIYELLILHIKANMNGFENEFQRKREKKLTEKMMKNIEIALPEF